MSKPSFEWIKRRRQELLGRTTDAEKSAFNNLVRLGFSPIRQFPIWTSRRMYFADLYIKEIKTIIELDGGYHYTSRQKRLDNNRSNGLWRMGYHVVRLSNHDSRNILKIKNKILLIIGRNIKR